MPPKNLLPHLGKRGQTLTAYYTFKKPGKTVSDFIQKHFAGIVRVVKTLCQLGQTKDFYLRLQVGKKYGVIINHRVNGVSQLEMCAVRTTQQGQREFQENVRFKKDEKADFFKMIFFLLVKLPKSTTRMVEMFRIGRKIVLEMHPLEQSYNSILQITRPELPENPLLTGVAPDVCKDFLRFGVRDNPIVQFFNPLTRRTQV